MSGRRAAILLSAAVIVGRTGDDPVETVARASTARAIHWLLQAQNADGSWGDNPGMPGEVGNTCIATLALLGTGSTPTRGPYCRPIGRALDWLALRATGWGNSSANLDNGTLLQRKLGPNIDLYLLTLLSAQVLGHTADAHDDRQMQIELQRAVDRIAALQKPNGEWETTYEPMLTTITAWLALRQASDAGIAVRGASERKVLEYLKTDCLRPETGVFAEARWNRQTRFVTQAGALRVLHAMGEGLTDIGRKATGVILRMTWDQDVGGSEGGEEFLGALFATQALQITGGETFAAFWPKIVEALADCQNRDGSWVGHHCITGRVFCTSCAILTLRTPDRLLPMDER